MPAEEMAISPASINRKMRLLGTNGCMLISKVILTRELRRT
jgi:hypothetical protein